MIISRTPYRISFFGGGSDYPAYYKRFGGQVLTTTIDRYAYISLRRMPPFLGTKYRIVWSEFEKVDRVEDIRHAGVRGCLQYLGVEDGIEVNHAGDLPARSGLGSSSSFTVGMLSALHAMDGRRPSAADLADQAIAVEQDVLKETVGVQDQIECAWGGLNLINIQTDGTYGVTPMILGDSLVKNIEDHLVLVFTGLQRHASEIAQAQIDNVDRRLEEMKEIVALVPRACTALRAMDMEEFGALLDESWILKRQLSDKVTSKEIDGVYDRARRAGAYGGKLLGAGGGGFMLLCVPPARRQGMLDSLGLLSVPVKLEHRGSQIVLAET